MLFSKYIQNEELGEIDIKVAQRLLWLANLFKIWELELHIIKNYILPSLSKENAIDFLEDAYLKMSYASPAEEEDELSESWNVLLGEALNLVANNLSFLIKLQKEKLLKLDDAIINELTERSFKILSSQFTADNFAVTEFIMQKREIDCPFDLLEREEAKIRAEDKKAFAEGKIDSTLTWNLMNVVDGCNRESEPFTILGHTWSLCIQSFKTEGYLYISIKSPKITKDSEEFLLKSSYYNKNNFFFNPSKKQMVIQSNNEPQIESQVDFIPNHCILTLSTSIQIKELKERNKGIFSMVSLFAGSERATMLRKIPLSKLPNTEGTLGIEVYMKMNYTYPGILAYISRNFDWLYNSPNLVKLSKTELLVLLKHKYLNIKREEDALVALCIWCKSLSLL